MKNFIALWSMSLHSLLLLLLLLFNYKSLVVTTSFNIKQFYILLTNCVSVIFMDLRINSDYFPLQNLLITFGKVFKISKKD